ncbi:MAG: hypothetical protein RLZZ342_454 [Candidatus Parcubacteria bacterium]
MRALYGLLGGLPRIKMFAAAVGMTMLGSCLAIASGSATTDVRTLLAAATNDTGVIVLSLAADTSDGGIVLLAEDTGNCALIADPFDGLTPAEIDVI